MSTSPRVSLCMIVYDEADCLPAFLAATSGLYDELIAVDAHSKDETVALLEAHGATVVKRAWDDDFSAARNRSLELARGEWVLFLDADELPDAEAVASLKEIAGREDAGAAMLRVENEFEHGWRTVTPLMRMFRRNDAIRFSHAIHETVVEPVMGMLIERGLDLVHAEGRVLHSGYTPGRLSGRNKRELSERILLRALAEDDSNLYNWFKLLEGARFFGDDELFSARAPDAMRALQAADEESLGQAHFGGELLALISSHLFVGRPAEELEELMGWEARLPQSAAFNLRRGQVREELGDFDGAIADFRACVDQYQHTGNLQLAGVRPLMGMARVAIARGELTQALGFVELALGEAPRDPEAVLAMVALSGQLGGAKGRDDVVAAYREAVGDCPELAQALAHIQGVAAGDGLPDAPRPS